MIRFTRLRTRVILFFVALVAVVQIAAFYFVNASNSRNAREKVKEELNVGDRVFARLIRQNAEKLSQAARVLTADFAFREAVATHDNLTILSALENQGARIGASAVIFVGLSATDCGSILPDGFKSYAVVSPNIPAGTPE